MSTKPDAKHIKALVERANEIDRNLRATLDSQRGEIAAVRRAADAFYAEKLKSALEALDVDMLSQGKRGIRVSYLKNAGIKNIYQLSKLRAPPQEGHLYSSIVAMVSLLTD